MVIASTATSFTGVVTDSMCGATHNGQGKDARRMHRICVKDGMKYALAADKKLYTLEGHEADSRSLLAKSHSQGNSEGRYAVRSGVAASK